MAVPHLLHAPQRRHTPHGSTGHRRPPAASRNCPAHVAFSPVALPPPCCRCCWAPLDYPLSRSETAAVRVMAAASGRRRWTSPTCHHMRRLHTRSPGPIARVGATQGSAASGFIPVVQLLKPHRTAPRRLHGRATPSPGSKGAVSARHVCITSATTAAAPSRPPQPPGLRATLSAARRATHAACCGPHWVGSSGRLPRSSSCHRLQSPLRLAARIWSVGYE